MKGANPRDGLSLTRRDFALPRSADIERHQEMEMLVIMAGEVERRQACPAKLDVEFFLDFATKRILGRFTGLDLSAWEFPQARHRFAFGALGNKNAFLGVDESDSRDENERLRHRRLNR
jgi:hypothetical protein